MKWFQNLGISRKLAVAFTATTLMTLALGALALSQLSRLNKELGVVGETWVPAVQQLGEMRSMLGDYRILELTRVSLADDRAAADALLPQLASARQAITRAETAALAHTGVASDQQLALRNRVSEGYRAYFAAHDRIETALAAGNTAEARRISATDSRIARQELAESVKALTVFSVDSLGQQVAATHTAYRAHVTQILVVLALLTGLAIALGWNIARAIATPLRRAAEITRHLAEGRLDDPIDIHHNDESGQLLQSLKQVQLMLRDVVASQKELAHQHDIGTISHRIDAARFPGEYGTMAETVNACVAQHIGVKMRVVEVMRRYAIGDLSADMDRLPGEKVVITQAMDATKASLGAINNEIKRLSNAAAAGDFSQRGDAQSFEHDFRQMVTSLNQLMETTEVNLDHISQMLKSVADGDLTHRMEGEFKGVFAVMRDDANATIDNLTDIVHRIQSASGSINRAASEIASGNQDLSQRTEQQAANLEETAASMEELTSTVRQNAEHARQANQLALGAATVATEGGQVVSQVVGTMSEIEQSSRRIADIITVIDGIAFQTNILALNAAVEAARAGEQGRGFAVVAGEVRTLAQRSAGAAKDIKSLIDDSVAKVAGGSALVNRAGSTMEEIVGSVKRVTDIMSEISAASQEQSAGIEQVSQTVTQMDETTQQNAALVEEATAAARSMEDQARQLDEAVGAFRTAGQRAASQQAPARSTQPAVPVTASNVLALPVARQRGQRKASTPAPREVLRPAVGAGDNGDHWQEF